MRLARADHAVSVLCTLLFLPGALLEEALHALGALPWATRVSVELEPGSGTARTRVHYRDGTPAWAIRLGHLLPELVASLAGVAVIAWWALGGSLWLPSTTVDWLLLSLVGAQYLALVLPSAADLDHSPGGETP